MDIRRLGRSGMEVPALSLGGAGFGDREQVSDEEAIGTVEYALEHRINYIDTSPLYGESERRIGLALTGVPRSHYLLSTQTGTHPTRRGDYSGDETRWSVENSLRLLKTDHSDLLLVHDPRDENDIEAIFAAGWSAERAGRLEGAGVIGAIGLGQRRYEWHRRAILSGRFDVILTYNDYHPLRTTARASGLLKLAKQHNVGVINGSPMAHGLLNGSDPTSEEQAVCFRRPGARRRRRNACMIGIRPAGLLCVPLFFDFACARPSLIAH